MPESEQPSLENGGGGGERGGRHIRSETWRGGRRPSLKRPRGREEPRAERPGAGAPSPGLGGGRDPSLEAASCPHPAPTVSTPTRAETKRLHLWPYRGTAAPEPPWCPHPGWGPPRPPGRSFRSPSIAPLLPAKSAARSGRSLIAGLTVIFPSRLLHLHSLQASPPHILLHPPGLSLDGLRA